MRPPAPGEEWAPVLGEYDVHVRLHREVTATVRVKVEAEAAPEAEAAQPPEAPVPPEPAAE